MRPISCLVVSVFLFSCGNKSAITKKLSLSDSLVISFNIPNTDSIINMVSTTEKKAIQKLAGYPDSKKAEVSGCGFDGNMIFYRQGEIIMPLVFQFQQKGCRQFIFENDNETKSTLMSDEASDFLNSLLQEKNWY